MKNIPVTIKLLFLAIVFCVFSSCDLLQQIMKNQDVVSPLTNEEVIRGLRAALNTGADSSVSVLSKTDGFYKDALLKILLPPEAQNIMNNISKVPGGDKLVQDAILAINRAAEDATPEAKTIFLHFLSA